MDRLGGFFGSRDAEDHLDDDHVEEDDADLDPPPSPVGQDERRMQVRAYNHWASLLGDRNFPSIEDLAPERLDDFGPHSVLLDFTGGIEDPRIAFIGSELASECGHEGEIARLSDVPGRSVLSRITDHFMQILANEAPIGFEAEFVNDREATVLYRGILLPYSSNAQTIDFIYGVINWKEMADRHTADALLLEIDQALAEPIGRDDEVLELGKDDMIDHSASGPLPRPAFGPDAATMGPEESAAGPGEGARADRSVDALGNPVGSLGLDDALEPDRDDYDDYDGGIKTAADYGLPDWDEEDDQEDDVDGLVDPLADETASSLISLVSRGIRAKKSVDLSTIDPPAAIPQIHDADLPGSSQPRVPQAYTPPVELSVPEAAGDDPEPRALDGANGDDGVAAGFVDSTAPGSPGADDRTMGEDLQASDGEAEEDAEIGPRPAEGLYDCLALAREMALAAQSTEDRSRKALYSAVGRAYDFSLEAQASPEDYDELLVENGLTVQDRAPMTPVVKLVFGAEYDKTRLTEYAAVLMHAHRVGVERGTLAGFLREAEGGLKGVVQAERRARKEEQGKPVEDARSVRPALARKLRKLAPLSLGDLDEEGAEFALVMLRRTQDGGIEIIGEVPEDIALVERAARKLLG